MKINRIHLCKVLRQVVAIVQKLNKCMLISYVYVFCMPAYIYAYTYKLIHIHICIHI